MGNPHSSSGGLKCQFLQFSLNINLASPRDVGNAVVKGVSNQSKDKSPFLSNSRDFMEINLTLKQCHVIFVTIQDILF